MSEQGCQWHSCSKYMIYIIDIFKSKDANKSEQGYKERSTPLPWPWSGADG